VHLDYVDEQQDFANRYPGGVIHNDDYIGAASFNIFVGVFVATIFGAAFFFDLFWPVRKESSSVKLAWKICAILASLLALASALTMTIILATHDAWISGLTASEIKDATLRGYSNSSPLSYRKNARALASVVLIWPGWVATVAR
jgi:hypothetical protein